jgi:hypothetical protein
MYCIFHDPPFKILPIELAFKIKILKENIKTKWVSKMMLRE